VVLAAGLLLAAGILVIRLARLGQGLDGPDEWRSITFDLVALTLVATVILPVVVPS
jgi:hypothetical protein